jgi:hypothetical protein
MALWRRTPHKIPAINEWITREFAARGLSPPRCTPEALAQALERERQLTIEFRAHASDDPGVYGLLYRKEGCDVIGCVKMLEIGQFENAGYNG